MKLIPLTQGKFAQVDDEDYEYLMQWKWIYKPNAKGNMGYASRRALKSDPKKPSTLSMHRQIMGAKEGQILDHKDNDRLNNQRANLRFCTAKQNAHNRLPVRGAKYNGVCKHKTKVVKKDGTVNHHEYWAARININGKAKRLGLYKTPEEAAMAVNEAAKKYRGEFARLNILG